MDELECAVGRGHELLPPSWAGGEPCWNGARHLIGVEDATIPFCCRHYNLMVEAYAAFSIEQELG